MSKRKTESQIVAMLKEAEVGMPVKDLCRKYGIFNPTIVGFLGGRHRLSIIDSQRL